jgi:hypothetical protein
MRQIFKIPDDVATRLWFKYPCGELGLRQLSKMDISLQVSKQSFIQMFNLQFLFNYPVKQEALRPHLVTSEDF